MIAYVCAVALGREPVPAYTHRMAEIVNLRQARKAKARAKAADDAAVNRAAFGRNKTEKKLTKAQKEAAERKLDGHKRDDT